MFPPFARFPPSLPLNFYFSLNFSPSASLPPPSKTAHQGTVLGSTEINFTLIDVAPVPFSVTPARTDVTTPAGLTTTIEIQVSLVDSIAQPFDLGALYLPSFASLAPSSTPISRGTNTLIIDPGTHEAGHNTCEYGSLQAVARGVEYSQTVNFLICLTVSSSSAVFVSGFTILNANTDSAVSPMFNNDVSLPLFSMPASFSIQIHTNPPVVTKVRLFYAFQALGDPVPASPLPFHRAELFSPYTLFGDNNLSGDIYGIPRAVGTYHFTAVPYVSGVPGTSHRFSLYVYNTSG